VTQQSILSNSIQPLGIPNTGTGTDEGDTWNAAVARLNAMFGDLYGSGTTNLPSTYRGSGNVSRTAGVVGSSATNTTQTLASYVMPASLFNTTGQMLEITAFGVVAGNAAPKTLALSAGGVQLTTGTQTGNAYAWELYGQYMRTGASTQAGYFSGQASGGIVTQKASTDTSVETGTIAINVTMADASAGQSNVLLFGFAVEYFG
jgi:hypothetical protein